MFEGDELNDAMGVPFLYGMAEIFFISIYCLWAWKAGWTKAPANESIWKVIATSYEVGEDSEEEAEEKDDGKDTKDGEATAITEPMASEVGSP